MNTPSLYRPHVATPCQALIEVGRINLARKGQSPTVIGGELLGHGADPSESLPKLQAIRSGWLRSYALEPHPMLETIDARRRRKLAWLVEKYGAGEIADRSGVNDAYIDQVLKGRLLPAKKDGSRAARGLGNANARAIEAALELGSGWFDQADEASELPEEPITPAGKRQDEDVTIRQFAAGGSMGRGVVLRDQPGVIQGWRVSPEWLAQNVRNISAPTNLCIVTGFGDSMRPMFNPGDPLLVDRGVKTVEYDAIYFFRVGDEGFVKRLQRIPGVGLVALSENKAYDKWTITDDMDMEVFGRVLKVWRGEDF